jgi:hypothetical protein
MTTPITVTLRDNPIVTYNSSSKITPSHTPPTTGPPHPNKSSSPNRHKPTQTQTATINTIPQPRGTTTKRRLKRGLRPLGASNPPNPPYPHKECPSDKPSQNKYRAAAEGGGIKGRFAARRGTSRLNRSLSASYAHRHNPFFRGASQGLTSLPQFG